MKRILSLTKYRGLGLYAYFNVFYFSVSAHENNHRIAIHVHSANRWMGSKSPLRLRAIHGNTDRPNYVGRHCWTAFSQAFYTGWAKM